MFVLCPHCQFLVALDPATGEPPLRCPRCDGVVQSAVAPAAAGLPEDAPSGFPVLDTQDPQASPRDEPDLAAPQDDSAIIEIETTAPPVVAETTAEPSNATDVEATREAIPSTAPAPRKRAPSFVLSDSTAQPATRGRWWVPASLAGLTLLLLLQIVLADRAQLAADARWRPLLSQVCATLRCSLPPWRDVDAITLLDRDVRPDARRPGVLHATASFRNDARWPQPWPMLLLTLSDADGRVTGARMFTPSEYLHVKMHPQATTQNTLASGQSASVALDIIEPEPRTVAFTFDFR